MAQTVSIEERQATVSFEFVDLTQRNTTNDTYYNTLISVPRRDIGFTAKSNVGGH